jgi:hypothetical protein
MCTAEARRGSAEGRGPASTGRGGSAPRPFRDVEVSLGGETEASHLRSGTPWARVPLMSPRTELSLLAVILLVSSALSFSLLTDGHAWGDDFAAYIMQAWSLIHGTTEEFVRRNAFTIQSSTPVPGPITYPWGYPLLLAPVLEFLGVDLFALKLLNVVFFALFLIVLHALLRLRLSGGSALLLVGAFACNPTLLQAQDHVLSDVPFLFFSTLALYSIERSVRPGAAAPPALAAGAVGAAIFAATAIRLNGMLLLIVLATAQCLSYRGWLEAHRARRAALPYLTFGFLLLSYSLVLPSGDTSYLGYYRGLTASSLLSNLQSYAQLPTWMLNGIPLESVFIPVLELAFVGGLISHPLRNAASAAYVVVLFATFVPWPFTPVPRFLFPVLPPIALIAADGARSFASLLSPAGKRISRAAGLGLAGGLVALSLFTSARAGWANLQDGRVIRGPFDPKSTAMFEFVREHIPTNGVIVFHKPRALRLITGRDAFRTTTCDGLRGGDYVVIHNRQPFAAQVAEPEVCASVDPRALFENGDFTVYGAARPAAPRNAHPLGPEASTRPRSTSP